MGILIPYLVIRFPIRYPWDSALRLHPLSLQNFYDQVASPLLVDVELQYPRDAVSALTQHRHKQYYDGSEIMVAGHITDHKLGSFKAEVQARGVNDGPWRPERPDSKQRLQTHFSPSLPAPGGPLFPQISPTLSMTHTPRTWGLDRLERGQCGLD